MMVRIPARRPFVPSAVAPSLAATIFGIALIALVALAPAPGAKAATYPVSGKQIVVDEAAGTSRMTGGLLGRWKVISIKELSQGPTYRAKGTERFDGCLDRHRDGSCAGDPSGTLDFSFLYWGRFEADDSLVWGSCWHPVTKGSGDFAGAVGVLMMVDTPEGKRVTTRYTGNLTIGDQSLARASSAPRPSCG